MVHLAVFASGRGSNFRAIYQNISSGKLPARLVLFVTDNPDAPALQFAQEIHIPAYVVSPRAFSSPTDYTERLLHLLKEYGVEWIALAGYLKKIPAAVVQAYPNRIVNIHPALLPFFGGKGMYGMRVHEAVFASGMQVSGVTVHFVNENYDEGPIIYQEAVDIRECRNAEEIAQKILPVEHRVYSEVLKRLFTRSFTVHGKRVTFVD